MLAPEAQRLAQILAGKIGNLGALQDAIIEVLFEDDHPRLLQTRTGREQLCEHVFSGTAVFEHLA